MYGYVKVGSAVPKLRVADCVYNKEEILKLVEAAAAKQVRVLSFPELSVTGYTCADLFFQAPLLHAAEQAIQEIAEATKALKDKNLGIKVDSREDSEKYEEGTVRCSTALLPSTRASFWVSFPKHISPTIANFMRNAGLPLRMTF